MTREAAVRAIWRYLAAQLHADQEQARPDYLAAVDEEDHARVRSAAAFVLRRCEALSRSRFGQQHRA